MPPTHTLPCTAPRASSRMCPGEALETSQVQVSDAYGDGRHVSIDVVSTLFEGKSSMARQRMVYKVGVTVHA